jgi:hypothetical protein
MMRKIPPNFSLGAERDEQGETLQAGDYKTALTAQNRE